MSRKKQTVKNIIFTILVLAFAAALVAIPYFMETKTVEQNDQRIFSVTAETGSIDTTLSGAGTLTEEDAVAATVPAGVEIDGYYVSNGDRVSAGDEVAKVNRTSVMQAISSVQETLEYLEEEISELSDKGETKTLTSASAARVKAVYAAVGDDVQDVVLEHGCLAVLSLDGYMAVSFEDSTGLQAGDTVSVTETDGTVLEGTVDSARLGTVIVLIDDSCGTIGETVTVSDSEGTVLAQAELYVHSESRVTAYTGTVSKVYVEENSKVSANGKLFLFDNVDESASSEMLEDSHRRYEEIMLELFILYQDGTVTAPCDGRVSGIPSDAVLLNYDGGNYTLSLMSAPEKTEGYLNRFGVVKEMTVSGTGADITVEMTEELSDLDISLADYKDVVNMRSTIAGLSFDADRRTVSVSKVYYWTGDEWIMKDASGLKEGDTLLFVYGQDLVWVIGTTQETADEPSTDEPSTDQPSTDEPSTDEPSTDEPSTDEPSTDQPSTDEPSTDGPSTDEPATDQPATDDPSPDQPTPDGPTGDIPSTDQPDGDPTSSDAGSSTGTFSGGTGTFSGGTGSFSGSTGSFSFPTGTTGTQIAEEIFTPYSTEETTLFSVTPLDTMTITITIDELDILSVREGQAAVVTIDALPGQTFPGVVTSIDTDGTNSGGNSKYTAVITLDRTEKMLGGMNAGTGIVVKTDENVLTVPADALVEEGTKTYVYTTYDEDDNVFGGLTEITTGVSDGLTVEVLSGLNSGDTVWYSVYDSTLLN